MAAGTLTGSIAVDMKGFGNAMATSFEGSSYVLGNCTYGFGSTINPPMQITFAPEPVDEPAPEPVEAVHKRRAIDFDLLSETE